MQNPTTRKLMFPLLLAALLGLGLFGVWSATPHASRSEAETGLSRQLVQHFPSLAEQLAPRAEFHAAQQTAGGSQVSGFRSQAVATGSAAVPAGLKPAEQEAWLAMTKRLDATKPDPLASFFPARYGKAFVVEGQGVRVAVRPVGGAEVNAEVENGQVIYRDAYPHTDSLHVVSAGRSEEFLYLRSQAAPREFGYEISEISDGARMELVDGEVRFTNEAGRGVKIETPWLIASNGQRRTDAVRWELDQGQAGARPRLRLLVAEGLSYPAVIDPSWTATGSLGNARTGHTATLLQNGKVLVAGGYNANGSLSSAELYDPATGEWTVTGSLTTGRFFHTATLLPSGKVLVVGGFNGTSAQGGAELYDPATGQWDLTDNLTIPRYRHTATLLPSGKVLVAGGSNNTALFLNSMELYDPLTGTWTETGSLGHARTRHTATLLQNGHVLFAGGGYDETTIDLAERYDPTTGILQPANSLKVGRLDHTATLLPDGKVLIAGGGFRENPSFRDAELYDPATGHWTITGSMNAPRRAHTATLLPSGKVLAVGWFGGSGEELYDPATGAWTTTGSLTNLRSSHTATLLPSGQVLVTGGLGVSSGSSTELYDPAAGAWSTPGTLVTGRVYHTATLLPSGKVLVVGGSGGTALNSAEVYDPATGAWSATGNLVTGRFYHTATLLPSGKVLVAGGFSGTALNSAELYDPATGAWSATGNLVTGRLYHTTTLLPSGKVLVAGGRSDAILSGAELYDPTTGVWTATGSLATPRENPTATLLPSGKVLVVGGFTGSGSLGSAQLYDPATGTWTVTGSLATARSLHTATLQPSGKVLVVGGENSSVYLNVAELYDPATGAWTATGSLAGARARHTATLLPSGEVLVAAGYNGTVFLSTSEVYDPGLGFAPAWQPLLSAVSPLTVSNNTALAASGSRFKGVSEASGGNGAQNSSSNYPLVQLLSLTNEQTLFLPVDAAAGWSNTSFTSTPVTVMTNSSAGFPAGHALVTVFANGIPSQSKFVRIIGNTAPAISAAPALVRQQGSPASNSPIATVSDDETPAGSLIVTATSVPAGLSVANIVNNNGEITADVRAECSATTGAKTIVLEVSDGELTTMANLTVSVTANTSPVIGYPGPQTAVNGQSLIITPTAGPGDNGSLTITAQNNLTNFSGSVDFNNVTGVFTVTNASPPGNYRLGVRVEDNCGSAAGNSFSLTVSKANTTTTVASSLNPSVFGQEVTFTAGVAPVASGAGLPTGTVVFSIDGAPQTPVSVSGGQASFVASTLSVGNRIITASYSGEANFNGSNGSLTQVVACPAITFAPAVLPQAQVNTAYPQTITASPAGGDYSFSVTGGPLPAGLTLNSNGTFSGAPAQSGTFNFRVTASGFGSCTAFRDYVLLVNCPAITVNPANLPGGNIGASYNQTLSATPAGTYNFSVTSGALPPGLMLNAATGAITGAPAVSGSFSFRVTASAGGCTGSRDYTVSIGCPVISLASLASATAGAIYSSSAAASPAGSYTYSLSAGNLPTGLTLHPTTGAVTGLPAVTGTFNFTVKAQTPNGCSATQSHTLTVACPAITLSSLAAPTLNSPYNQTVTASPSGSSFGFAVTAGALPAGLTLNSATGVISGTPTVSGSYNFTITASGFSGGFGGCAGARAYNFTLGNGGCPTITLTDLPNGQPGQLYNQSVTASPAGGYSYAVTAGSLPPGLMLYGSLGMLFGYPTQAGTFNFTVTATNASNCTGSKTYSVQIGGAALQSLVFGDFDGDGKADLSVWRGATGEWLTVGSKDGQPQTEVWGTSAAPYFDVMTPGDYDGDGRMDAAVFRRSTGQWLIKRSSDGAATAKAWGLATDIPVPGDYDSDGKTDIAVWRGEQGNWYILRSSDNQTETIFWGTSNAPYRDLPVPADYDGDGRTDIAVFRQMTGHWYIRQSSDGSTIAKHWGLGTDVPVAADYDGDGKADIAVWRGTAASWYIVCSSDGATQSISWANASLGDLPAPGDYDGDGKADAAVWQASSGTWAVRRSADAKLTAKTHGRAGDSPITARSDR